MLVETSGNSQEADEIVLVPVPRRQLAAVYAALADAMGSQPPKANAETAESDERVVVRGQGEWYMSKLETLDGQLGRLPNIRALIDLTAEKAPKGVSFRDAAEATGTPTNQLRAQVGALTKLSIKLFDARTWPMSVDFQAGGEAVYSMDPRVAEWWRVIMANRDA
jgi:hypothetical protein